MKRQARRGGQSTSAPLWLSRCSAPAVLVLGLTLAGGSVTCWPSPVVREAPRWIVAYTASAKSSATAASSEPLYLATAPYQSDRFAGGAPTVSRAYWASSAASPRMFWVASRLSRLGLTPKSAAAVSSVP